VAADDRAVVVVEEPAVAEQGAARRVGVNVAEGVDAVSVGHRA
jgi:hypothetical protein